MSTLSYTGADLIAVERRRQLEKEGWTPEHDDEHVLSELSKAASAYLSAATRQVCSPNTFFLWAQKPPEWPWDFRWWKPSPDPIRNLVKAGALIAAEIDRLIRKARAEGRS